MKESAVIIGASKGLGKSLAYVLAENGVDVILAARSQSELEAMANDLASRFQIRAVPMRIDLEKLNQAEALQFVNDCYHNFTGINQIYITAGIISDSDYGTESINVLNEIVRINFLGASFLIDTFSKKLAGVNSNITIISSVAVVRPRKKNIAYASSKVALEYFTRGLQHHYHDNPLRLQLYRIGYMETGMTAEKKLLLPSAKPETVARHIYNYRNKNFRVKYYPWFWSLIAIILKALPWFMFKKIKQ
ncbi:MAG TPA: SDR family NAD(P)-dependent oxidoreductase [Bacteroidia bacterium]|nr:SDR family NAD(P)-dependent oxidoreductase [Bacteroidia bacterium]